jgi:hypothetical protein
MAFSCRLPIIPVAILRLVNLNHDSGSTDYSWDIVLAVVLAQVEMHFSLIASTIPCLRPFLKALDTGYLATQAAQVDRSIVDPGTGSSYAKGSTNDPGSNRNSYTRNPHRTSFRNSYQTKTTAVACAPDIDTYPMDVHSYPTDDNYIAPFSPPPPLPVARKWKSPEELPVLDPCSSPAITSIHHPRQWRTGPPESVQKARHSLKAESMTSSQEDDITLCNQSVDKWIIHKTVGYAVTRSDSTASRSE